MMIVHRDGPQELHDPAAVQSRLERCGRERELNNSLLKAAARDAPGKPLWYVLAVSRCKENIVASSLTRHDINAWVPMRKVKLRRSRGRTRGRHRRRMRITPMFEGYVFVSVVPSAEAFVGLLSIRYVRSILGDNAGPVHVRTKRIEALAGLLSGGVLDTTQPPLSPGDRVEIDHGAFSFVEALVKDYREGADRAKCIATLFGGDVPIAGLSHA